VTSSGITRREAGGLTFGSLRRWAQLDNPTAFGEYAAPEVVMEALSGTHNDLAKLVHSMYRTNSYAPN
jgi:hypothetical protein